MKFIKINILPIFLAIVVFSSCKKDDGAIPERVSIAAVPTITTNIDPTGSQAIDLLNLGSFAGKFKVDQYFPGTTPPTKVDIVVRKWNGTANNGNVKVFKAGVTTFPTNITVTAAEIATLFGTPIVLGDTYDFAPDIYVGDRRFEAFPAVGAGQGAGLNGQPFFSEFARFTAICRYDPSIYEGDFEVVSDAWGDFTPGEVVRLTRVSNTSFSFTDPYAVPPASGPVPIVVNVTVTNNNVSITKISIGTKWVWSTTPNPPYPYTNAFVSTASGSVAPCSRTVTLGMVYAVDQGTFAGTWNLVLRKKP